MGPDPNDPAADPFTWFSQILGPPNSPFHQGVFTLKITIPATYPFAPPTFEFLTPILHPNVQNGRICLSLLEAEAGEWQAAMFVEHGVLAVIQMMQDNQAEDGFEEVSKLMLRDRKKWWTQASEMTRKYA